MWRSSPSAEAPPPLKPAAVAAAPPEVPAPAVPPAPLPAALHSAPVGSQHLLSQASTELHAENYAAAVQLVGQAGAAGADAKEIQKLEANVAKALVAKVARARKRKDHVSEAEAKALLARLRETRTASAAGQR
jgi:hypothetical protein